MVSGIFCCCTFAFEVQHTELLSIDMNALCAKINNWHFCSIRACVFSSDVHSNNDNELLLLQFDTCHRPPAPSSISPLFCRIIEIVLTIFLETSPCIVEY